LADSPDQPTGEFIEITLPAGAGGGRADKALADALPDWSRERLKHLFDDGRVLLNGTIAARRTPVSAGDVFAVQLPPPKSTEVEPLAIPLEILFEDEHVVAVNKPADLVTHPGAGVTPPTLCHALLHHTGGKLARAGGEERPGVVHRLDRPTTGVIVFAKTDEAYYQLVKAFAARLTHKEYTAIVKGVPALDAGSIREPIERDHYHRTRMCVRSDGKSAHTDWRVVERLNARHAWVHCRIHTGRTHQIRVHLSHLGMPLLGDSTYGYRADQGEKKEPRLFLHASFLGVPHPITGERLEIRAPRTEMFDQKLDELRNRDR